MRKTIIDSKVGSESMAHWKLSDVFLLVYFCAFFGNRTGVGFDYWFFRLSFVAYVAVVFFFDILPDMRSGKSRRLFGVIVAWFALFWGYAYTSGLWSISIERTLSSQYLTNCIQAFFLVAYLPYRVQSRGDFYHVMGILVAGCLYGTVLLILKTPESSWGGERVGSAIGLNANTVGLHLAFTSLCALFLARDAKNPLYYAIAALFIGASLFTGSKKAMFLGIAGLVLFFSLSYRGFKGLLYAAVGIATAYAVYWVAMNNPDLYHVLGRRIESFFNGSSSSDDVRDWLRDYAKLMFLRSPIFGSGFNAFVAEMGNIGGPIIAYCHCNQWELLADLGLIGFIIYYYIFIYIGYKLIVSYSDSSAADVLYGIVFLTLIFIFDYGYVSFVSPDVYVYITLIYCLMRVVSSEHFKKNENLDVESRGLVSLANSKR